VDVFNALYECAFAKSIFTQRQGEGSPAFYRSTVAGKINFVNRKSSNGLIKLTAMGYTILILLVAFMADILLIILFIYQANRHAKKATWKEEQRHEAADTEFDERDIYSDNPEGPRRRYWNIDKTERQL
jgi:hypothetical protein